MTGTRIGSRLYILAKDYFLPENHEKFERTLEILEIRKHFYQYLQNICSYLHSGISQGELDQSINIHFKPRYTDEDFSCDLWKEIIHEEIDDCFVPMQNGYPSLLLIPNLKKNNYDDNCARQSLINLCISLPESRTAIETRRYLCAQLRATYQNTCITHENLKECCLKMLASFNEPKGTTKTILIKEEIPKYFEDIVRGLLFRFPKKRYDMDEIEKNTTEGDLYICYQLESFFKFLFENCIGNDVNRLNTHPILFNFFDMRFSNKKFKELWEKTKWEVAEEYFYVFEVVDSENGEIFKIATKKEIVQE